MNDATLATQAVSPWLQNAESLDQWLRPGSTHAAEASVPQSSARAVDMARDVLQSIGRREEAIKAETLGVPASPRANAKARMFNSAAPDPIDRRLHGSLAPRLAADARQTREANGRDSRPAGINQVRQRRDAVLRLGVWAVLGALQERAAAAGRADRAFIDLIAGIGHDDIDVPPGLGPTLGYANSPAALGFFNDHLRNALHKLAVLYDTDGADFNALAISEQFDQTGVAVHRWSRTWTVAVAAVYADWLRCRNEGNLEAARQGLWRTADKATTVRFKAPAGLAVLPTRERSVHIDLWTNLVLAQVLAHDHQRWQTHAVQWPWHRVEVAMHDLGERDFREGSDGTRTVFRGLGVEMIYQAVFFDQVTARLQTPSGLERIMARTFPPDWQQTIDIALPDHCAGQQPNIRIVIGWQSAPKDLAAGSSSRRFAAPQDDLVLDPGQRQVLAAWKQRRSASADAIKPEAQAWRMDRTLLDWRHAMPADRFADESGQALPALGHLRLWDAAGPQVEWLDLELVVQARGGWHRLALYCVDVAQGGESRTWLLLDPGELDASALDVRFLRSALCDPTASIWVCRYAGLGAFVMLAVDLARLSGESMAEAANACP